MRRLILLSLLGLGGSALFAAAPASATQPPSLVVPTRPDVPVIINGVDASWCVVEGDTGLDHPGNVAPTVICRTPVLPDRGGGPNAYYPGAERPPRSGRLEVVPPANRPLPRPAESFHRVWSTESDHGPATVYAPFNPPPVIVSPNVSPSVSPPSRK